MNIYDALSKDHRQFERLLDRLNEAAKAGDDSWKGVVDELRNGVIAHARAEEALFYNALRDADESKDAVRKSYAEHAAVEGELRTLGAAKLFDAGATALAEKVRKDLAQHIQEEESVTYEAARKVFSEEEATQIGAAFEQMKTETAKGGESIVASTIDLIANLLPPRLTDMFRKYTQAARPEPEPKPA